LREPTRVSSPRLAPVKAATPSRHNADGVIGAAPDIGGVVSGPPHLRAFEPVAGSVIDVNVHH
jgi:hypothetical protein